MTIYLNLLHAFKTQYRQKRFPKTFYWPIRSGNFSVKISKVEVSFLHFQKIVQKIHLVQEKGFPVS